MYVFKESHFCDRRKFKRIKKKQGIIILYSFTPSDMNFQTIGMPKGFWQIFCHKNLLHCNILIDIWLTVRALKHNIASARDNYRIFKSRFFLWVIRDFHFLYNYSVKIKMFKKVKQEQQPDQQQQDSLFLGHFERCSWSK